MTTEKKEVEIISDSKLKTFYGFRGGKKEDTLQIVDKRKDVPDYCDIIKIKAYSRRDALQNLLKHYLEVFKKNNWWGIGFYDRTQDYLIEFLQATSVLEEKQNIIFFKKFKNIYTGMHFIKKEIKE
jgi:hypothetical protein